MQKPRDVPSHEALAKQVQAELAIRYEIRSLRSANDRAACLFISTRLVPWFYPWFVQWQLGREHPRIPGYPAMDWMAIHEGAEAIAKRIAKRYTEIYPAAAQSGPYGPAGR